MSGIKLTRSKRVLDSDENYSDGIKIDKIALIQPLDDNYKNPFFKVRLFLDLLSKTDDSFAYIGDQPQNISTKYGVDEDGVIIPDPEEVEKYMLKMKPIFDCEKFINENSFGFWDLLHLMHSASKNSASAEAQKKAYKRLENDPKQKALKEITEHYEVNKHQFKRRGYSAQFIREMHSKYPVIDSQKTIENLVSALNKENDDI